MNYKTYFLLLSFISTLKVNASELEVVLNQNHSDTITCVKYAPNGKYFLTASKDKTMRLWDIYTGNLIRIFNNHNSGVNSIDFSNDVSFIVSGDDEGNVVCSNIIDGTIKGKFKAHDTAINSLDLSTDGTKLITGSKDNLAKIWNIETFQLLHVIDKHQFPVMGVAFSNSGKKIVTAGYKSKETYLWDSETYEMTGNFFCSGCGEPLDVEFSSDDKEVLISRGGNIGLSRTGSIQTWDAEDKGNWWKKYWAPFLDAHATFSKDKKYILAGGWNGELFIYKTEEIEDKKNLRLQYQPPVYRNFKGHKGHIYSVQISPDGKYVLTASRDNSFILWDINTGRRIRKYESGVGNVKNIKLTSDGRYLYSANYSGNLKLWDLWYGKVVKTYRQADNISVFAIDNNLKYIACSEPNSINISIIDLEQDTLVAKLRGHGSKIKSLNFTKDGQFLISTAFEEVKTWDMNTFQKVANSEKLISKEIVTLKNGDIFEIQNEKILMMTSERETKYIFLHNGKVNAIKITPDEKYLISCSDDGTIRLWEILNGKEVVKLISVGKTEYIAVSPDYYYTCSKKASIAVSFTKDIENYSFSQFDYLYNRPDIVIDRIGYVANNVVQSYFNAHEKRMKKLNVTTNTNLPIHLPKLKLQLENIPLISTIPTISIEYEATDSLHNLDFLKIYVNDVPAFGAEGILLNSMKSKNIKDKFEIELSNGINDIQVSVINNNGVESIKQVFQVKYNEEKPVSPELYILTIGISKYKQSKYNLSFAAKDANDIEKAFLNSNHYRNVYTKVITDEEATRENIISATKFLSKASVNDVVIVFIAGHGLLDANYEYYFATYDIDFLHPEINGINFFELEKMLYAVKSRKKMLFMDTCHSGELDKDDIQNINIGKIKSGAIAFRSTGSIVQYKEGFGLENTIRLSQQIFSDLKEGTGATIISAAGGSEFALEGVNSKNGLFTSCLLQGLSSKYADKNNDMNITVSEIYDYVIKEVSNLSDGKQIPMSRSENLLFDFRVF